MRIDLKKDLPELYRPDAKDFVEVDVPPRRYLAIDGSGDPNTSEGYADAVAALYASAYAVRALLKARGIELVVGPLEGLWTSEDPTTFVSRDKDRWDWTMLIPLPDIVTEAEVAEGLRAAAAKRPELPVGDVRSLVLQEGRCLQILHVGSYQDEGPNLARLHEEVMPRLGVTWNGPHHEIYLSDPRRVAPEKLRTVLRQPVRPRAECPGSGQR